MNNTTTEFDFQLDKAVLISSVVWHLWGLTCVVFGVPGHILHMVITADKTNRKDPTSFYFTAISISELIYLLVLFWRLCVGLSIIQIDLRQIFSCGIFYSILIGPTILSNLYLASFSLDRIFMILYPSRSRHYITHRHICIRIIVILLIVILFMIPHHFFYYYEKKTTRFLCEYHEFVNHWTIHLWSFIHVIIFITIPYFITCSGAVILLRNRRQHRQLSQAGLSQSSVRMERNAMSILVIFIVNFITVLPYAALEIFLVRDRLIYHEALPLRREKLYRLLLNCFLIINVVNYTFKFHVRLIISKVFQNDFKNLFKRKSLPN